MYSTETDFYLRQQREDRRWTIAISLAVAVHAAVVLLVMFSPSLFQSTPIVEEVVSVSLVSMTDSAASSAPATSAPPAAAKPPAAEKKVEPPTTASATAAKTRAAAGTGCSAGKSTASTQGTGTTSS